MNPRKSCILRGITPGELKSIGTVNCSVLIQNIAFNTTFHLTDDDFPIPTDGILGRDFLTAYRCEINYDTWILSAYVNNIIIEIPIHNDLNGYTWIPARSEVFRIISNLGTNEDVVVNSAEIAPGVFCANAIVNSKAPFVKIINTNDYPIQINKPQFKFSLLNDFFIANVNKNPNADRLEKLSAELNLENIPTFAVSSIRQLCNEYNDIFSLKDDLLSYNNFYRQKNNLTDKTPVYIKKLS